MNIYQSLKPTYKYLNILRILIHIKWTLYRYNKVCQSSNRFEFWLSPKHVHWLKQIYINSFKFRYFFLNIIEQNTDILLFFKVSLLTKKDS